MFKCSVLLKTTILILVVLSSFCGTLSLAQKSIVLSNSQKADLIGINTSVLKDSTNALTAYQAIHSQHYTPNKNEIPSFLDNSITYWLHFSAVSTNENMLFLLNIDYPILNEVTFFKVKNGVITDSSCQGFDYSFAQKKYENQNFIFELNNSVGDTCNYYLKIRSKVPILLPIKVGTKEAVLKDLNTKDILSGIYFGIIIALFLYNIFIYFSIKDNSYIFYIVYILFIGLTQLTLMGYSWRFLWPNHPVFNQYSVIIFPCIAGVSAIGFTKLFLNIRATLPKVGYGFNFFALLYMLAAVLVFCGYYSISYHIIDLNVFVLVIFALIISIVSAARGNRSAWFFLASWSILIVAIVLFVLRNFGILPSNNFTGYILYLGSALQAILLSIALADRINVYKKEKEKSQAEALHQSLENEKLVKKQNVVLEQKVLERTVALQDANTHLNVAMQNLQDAQIQLVEAEKMASLGQLTAGVAHEINNPINFVKSNIRPLQLDVKDLFEVIDAYNELHKMDATGITQKLLSITQLKNEIDVEYVKSEITSLMIGIEEGADRTAEIVRSLRTFSRLDESEMKAVDIHECIDSTLVILRNATPPFVKVIRDFKADGIIECYPGKLNQVFMNIINNSIQAIKSKKQTDFENETITVSTRDIDSKRIEISIKDSGIGMSEDVKHKMFDPFFTTKEVGEGTGLGLAIVFKIIKKHGAKIEVVSSVGNGAEFILTLFHALPSEAHL